MNSNNLKIIYAYTGVILFLTTTGVSIVSADPEISDPGNRFSFTGKELDETGQYYFEARFYDSELGRFSSPDPAGGFNRYSYCGNNPLKYVDPSGCQYVEVCPADALVVEQGFTIDGGAILSTEAGYLTFVGFDLDNTVANPTWDDVVAASKHIFSRELTEEEIANELTKPNAITFDMGIIGDRVHHANYVFTDFLWPWKIDEDFWDLTVAIIGFGLCAYTCTKEGGGKTSQRLDGHFHPRGSGTGTSHTSHQPALTYDRPLMLSYHQRPMLSHFKTYDLTTGVRVPRLTLQAPTRGFIVAPAKDILGSAPTSHNAVVPFFPNYKAAHSGSKIIYSYRCFDGKTWLHIRRYSGDVFRTPSGKTYVDWSTAYKSIRR